MTRERIAGHLLDFLRKPSCVRKPGSAGTSHNVRLGSGSALNRAPNLKGVGLSSLQSCPPPPDPMALEGGVPSSARNRPPLPPPAIFLTPCLSGFVSSSREVGQDDSADKGHAPSLKQEENFPPRPAGGHLARDSKQNYSTGLPLPRRDPATLTGASQRTGGNCSLCQSPTTAFSMVPCK